jgi:hypothetical protein
MADLYRAYGKAAMHAAAIENKLVLLIAMKYSEGKDDSEFRRQHERWRRKTLGALINEAFKAGLFTNESKENLELLLEYRNWMVHELARDTLGFIVQKDGLAQLEQVLLDMADFFVAVSNFLHALIEEITVSRGISKEHVQNLVVKAFSANIQLNKLFQSEVPDFSPPSHTAAAGHS